MCLRFHAVFEPTQIHNGRAQAVKWEPAQWMVVSCQKNIQLCFFTKIPHGWGLGVQFNQFIANISLFIARIFSVDKKGIRRKDILVRRPRQMFYHLEWPLYRANKYTGDHNWIYLFYVFHFMPVETNRICGLSDPDRMLVIRRGATPPPPPAGTSSVFLCIHHYAPTNTGLEKMDG